MHIEYLSSLIVIQAPWIFSNYFLLATYACLFGASYSSCLASNASLLTTTSYVLLPILYQSLPSIDHPQYFSIHPHRLWIPSK